MSLKSWTLLIVTLGFSVGADARADGPKTPEEIDAALSSGLGSLLGIECSTGKAAQLSREMLAELNPFPEECTDPEALRNLPSLFAFQHGASPNQKMPNDEGKIFAKNILYDMIGRIRYYNKRSEVYNSRYLSCLSGQLASQCENEMKYINETVPEMIKSARYELGQSYSTPLIKLSSYDQFVPNSELSALDTFQATKYNQMSAEEFAVAQKEKRDAVRSLEISYNPAIHIKTYGNKSNYVIARMAEIGESHLSKYREIAAENPYVVFMPDAKNVKRDFGNALRAMNQNIKESEEILDAIEAKLESSPGIPEEAIYLMNYRDLASGMLSEDPRLCGMMSMLERYRIDLQNDKNARKALGIVGSLAGGIYLKAAKAGIGAMLSYSVASGAAYASYDIFQYGRENDQAETRNLRRFTLSPEDLTSDGLEAQQYYKAKYDASLASLPIVLSLSVVGGGGLHYLRPSSYWQSLRFVKP